ncbi:unnamed protein product [Adineta ricciae]|uniref:Uncharacterized protein n=2 Tax=Adineta ricciae TaxID=249248 RepID=A0A815IF64_ADIRI|nr:unnamed protein product [Adineta ricciae]
MEETINSSLRQFYSTTLINNYLIDRNIFKTRINELINSFKKSTREKFGEIFQVTREFVHGNTFLSADNKSWKYDLFKIYHQSIAYPVSETYQKGQCTCATSLHCVESAMFNNISIDGLFFGCYPIEAMLYSSLECLYKKPCLDLISSSVQQDSPGFSVDVLRLEAKYSINETVQHILDRLFVNEWSFNYSYFNYTEKCHSTECTHSSIQKFNVLHILTTIISLYGCLTILLTFLIPLIINISFRMYCGRIQMTIEPDLSP